MTTDESEFVDSKYYDMSARDSKEESGQKFRMSANGGEETGRIKHAEHKNVVKGI